MVRYSLFLRGVKSGYCAMLGLLIFLCVFKTPAVSNSKEVEILGDKFRLLFSMAIERFYRKILTINELGQCELVLESNIEEPALSQIGQYSTEISAKDALQLRDRVLSLADVPLPDEGTRDPGEPIFEVLLEQGGEIRTKIFDPHAVPKRLQVIGREIRALETKARKNLIFGIRLDVALSAQQIDRDSSFALILKFSAEGNKPIRFYNPLFTPEEGAGKIVISGERSDIKPSDIQYFHMQAEELRPKMLQEEGRHASAVEPIVDIDPNESLILTFNTVLDWPPGKYDVSVIMDSNGPQEQGKNVIIGRITTPPQPLVITGISKPEDEGATHYEPPKL